MSKKISEVFDVEPVKTHVSLPDVPLDPSSGDAGVIEDAELARTNMREMLDLGNRALENAYEVAVQSESPRAYEVLSTMLKTMADMNSQLLGIHEQKKKALALKDKSDPTTQVTNNVAFVGTTSELNRLIMEKLGKQ